MQDPLTGNYELQASLRTLHRAGLSSLARLNDEICDVG
jgi:hypothetical protein